MIWGVILIAIGLLGQWLAYKSNNFNAAMIFLLVFICGSFISAVAVKTHPKATYSYVEAEPVSYSDTQTFFEDNEGNILPADGKYPGGEYLLTVKDNEILVVWQNIVIGDVG